MENAKKPAGITAYAEQDWIRGVYQVTIYQNWSDGTQTYCRIEKEYPSSLRYEAKAHAAALTTRTP